MVTLNYSCFSLECLSPLTWIWGHDYLDHQEPRLLLETLKCLLCVWSVYILSWHTCRLTPVTLSTSASWDFVEDERSMQISSFSQSLSCLSLWAGSNQFFPRVGFPHSGWSKNPQCLGPHPFLHVFMIPISYFDCCSKKVLCIWKVH